MPIEKSQKNAPVKFTSIGAVLERLGLLYHDSVAKKSTISYISTISDNYIFDNYYSFYGARSKKLPLSKLTSE